MDNQENKIEQKNKLKNYWLPVFAILIAAICLVATIKANSIEDKPVQSTIGYVDVQTVMAAHPNMAVAKQTMAKEYAAIQNEMMDVKALPQEQQQAKVDELRKRLAEKETQVMIPVKESADRAINEVMKKHGIVAVFDKRASVAGGIDITKDVLVQEGVSEKDADTILAQTGEQN